MECNKTSSTHHLPLLSLCLPVENNSLNSSDGVIVNERSGFRQYPNLGFCINWVEHPGFLVKVHGCDYHYLALVNGHCDDGTIR
jgi:hypothetical protein